MVIQIDKLYLIPKRLILDVTSNSRQYSSYTEGAQ